MIVGGIERWLPVVIVATCSIPVGLLAALFLERARARRDVPSARRRSWTEVGILVATLPWLWMILTPLPGEHALRLVPLLDLTELAKGRPDVALAQVGGNLLVFAGYGFLAPVRWRMSLVMVVVTAASASATVEAAQYVFQLGRVSSVDDVLLNAAGAGLAALCSRPWWNAGGMRSVRKQPR
jgi:VanZ like family